MFQRDFSLDRATRLKIAEEDRVARLADIDSLVNERTEEQVPRYDISLENEVPVEREAGEELSTNFDVRSRRCWSCHASPIATKRNPITERPATAAAAGSRSPSMLDESPRDKRQAANERVVRVYSASASLFGRRPSPPWRPESASSRRSAPPRQQKKQHGGATTVREQHPPLAWPLDVVRTQVEQAADDKSWSDWQRQPFRPLKAGRTRRKCFTRPASAYRGLWNEDHKIPSGNECTYLSEAGKEQIRDEGHARLQIQQLPLERSRNDLGRGGRRPQSANLRRRSVIKESAASKRARLLELQRLLNERKELQWQLAEVKQLILVAAAGKVRWEMVMAGILGTRSPAPWRGGKLVRRRKRKKKRPPFAPSMSYAHEATTGIEASATPRESVKREHDMAKRLGCSVCQAERAYITIKRGEIVKRKRRRSSEQDPGQIYGWRAGDGTVRRAPNNARDPSGETLSLPHRVGEDQTVPNVEKRWSARGRIRVNRAVKLKRKKPSIQRPTSVACPKASGTIAISSVHPDSRTGSQAIPGPTNGRRGNADDIRYLASTRSMDNPLEGLEDNRQRSPSQRRGNMSVELFRDSGSEVQGEKQVNYLSRSIDGKDSRSIIICSPDNFGRARDTVEDVNDEYEDDFESSTIQDSFASDCDPSAESSESRDLTTDNQGSIEDKKQLEENSCRQHPGTEIRAKGKFGEIGEDIDRETQGELNKDDASGRRTTQSGDSGSSYDTLSYGQWHQDGEQLIYDEQEFLGQFSRDSNSSGGEFELIWCNSSNEDIIPRAELCRDSPSCIPREDDSDRSFRHDEYSTFGTEETFPSAQPKNKNTGASSAGTGNTEEPVSTATFSKSGSSLFDVRLSSDDSTSDQTWSLDPYKQSKAEGIATAKLRQNAGTSNEPSSLMASNRGGGRDLGGSACDEVLTSEDSSLYRSLSPTSQESEGMPLAKEHPLSFPCHQNESTGNLVIHDFVRGIMAPTSGKGGDFDQVRQSDAQKVRPSDGEKPRESEVYDGYDEVVYPEIRGNIFTGKDLDRRQSFRETMAHEGVRGVSLDKAFLEEGPLVIDVCSSSPEDDPLRRERSVVDHEIDIAGALAERSTLDKEEGYQQSVERCSVDESSLRPKQPAGITTRKTGSNDGGEGDCRTSDVLSRESSVSPGLLDGSSVVDNPKVASNTESNDRIRPPPSRREHGVEEPQYREASSDDEVPALTQNSRPLLTGTSGHGRSSEETGQLYEESFQDVHTNGKRQGHSEEVERIRAHKTTVEGEGDGGHVKEHLCADGGKVGDGGSLDESALCDGRVHPGCVDEDEVEYDDSFDELSGEDDPRISPDLPGMRSLDKNVKNKDQNDDSFN